MDKWTITEVWNIDDKLVIGDTLEKALSVWRDYTGFGMQKEPKRIERVYIGSPILGVDAIIGNENPSDKLTKAQVIEVIRALKNYRQVCLGWDRNSDDYIAEQLIERFIGKPDIQVVLSNEKADDEQADT